MASLNNHDLRLLRQLRDEVEKGDILLGDRAYGEFTTLAFWPTQGVDVVARLHQKRKVDFRKARRLAKNDALFVWTKGYQQSDVLSAKEWAKLRCKTPALAEKELLLYLIAHNVIRCVMAEAVARHQVDLQRVSFKGTIDAARQFTTAMLQARSAKLRRQLWDDLLLNLARDLVPLRPGRREPRAVKRRPKPFPLLTKPRHQFKEIEHRSRHWKGKPRNYRALN